jgi:hypothetical protein
MYGNNILKSEDLVGWKKKAEPSAGGSGGRHVCTGKQKIHGLLRFPV